MYSLVRCPDCQYLPFITFKSSGGFVPAQYLKESIGSVVFLSEQLVRSIEISDIVVNILISFYAWQARLGDGLICLSYFQRP